MFKYIIAFVLGTPLIGILMVENGEYAISVGLDGYKNGAATAYSIYAFIVVIVAVIISLITGKNATLKSTTITTTEITNETTANFQQFSYKLFVLSFGFLFVMLFGFGAIKVWLGEMGKGEFRAGLGTFGSLAYLMTKFIIPSLLAYLTLLFLSSKKNILTKFLFFVNILLVFIVGATWGFKSTSLAMLLPSVLLAFWEIRLINLLKMGIFTASTLVILFYLFDSNAEETTDAFGFLFTRITVIQGDISWYIWNLHNNGDEFPSYWPTLLAALGDNSLSIFGLSRDNHYDWMLHHYDWMMNYIVGVPLHIIAEGHSTTGTPFTEGIIAGGIFGIIIFSLIAGAIIGITYIFLNNSIQHKNYLFSTILSTYFCFMIFPWLNAGAVVQLFHIANIVGLIIAFLFILAMRKNKSFKTKKYSSA